MRFVEIVWQSEMYRQEIRLRDDMLREPLGLTFTPDDLQAESSQLHFGMLDEENGLIACAVVVPLTSQNAKLRQMVVVVSFQRRGIGTALVNSIESVLADRGFVTIELHARDTAIGFYEKLGYSKQGPPFDEVTIAHWKMTKTIGR